MAKQDLLCKIRAEAEEKAATVRAEAKARADELVYAAKEESVALSESARKLASSSSPEVIRRRRSMAELEVRKMILGSKQKIIGEAYEKAIERILSSPAYPELLLAMIVSQAEEGDSILFSEADKKRLDVQKIASQAEKKTGFSLPIAKEKGDFRGGIVLLGKRFDKNLTLETELERIRSEKDSAAETLFS